MPLHPFLIALCLWLGVIPHAGAAVEAGGPGALPPTLVTAEVIQAKITEAEANPDLAADEKTKLLALYREAQGNLKQIDANRARITAFEEASRSAPEETSAIRERLDAAKGAAPAASLEMSADAPRRQIELQLEIEQADLAVGEARRADLKRRLAHEENRPASISQRLKVTQEQQEAIAATLRSELARAEGLALAQAQRWGQETRYVALSTEIKALDQELRGLPTRLKLLEAKRDEEAANLDRLSKRVEALKALVDARRATAAVQAQTLAEQLRRETAGLDPLLQRLAAQNVELAEALSGITARLDALDQEQAQAERLAERIQAHHKQEQAAAEMEEPSTDLGPLLLEHRELLPDFKVYERKARALKEQVAAINVSRLRHQDEASGLSDLEHAVDELAAKLAADPTPSLRAKLRDLLQQRQGLLAQQLETEAHYQTRLRKLQAAEGGMLQAARGYDAFLKQHLFWLATGERTRLADLANLPQEIRRLLAPAPWSHLASGFGDRLRTSPVFWLTLMLCAALVWKRRALIAAIEDTASQVGEPQTDRFGHTLRALLLTLSAAAPLPLLLGVTGWLLMGALPGIELSHAVGSSLLHVAVTLFGLLTLREIGRPSGLAIAHFRWPEPAVRTLRSELGWLVWVYLPASFVARIAFELNPIATGEVITRFGMALALLALALFLYRVLRPRHGLLEPLRLRGDKGLLLRAYPLWFPLLVASPFVILAAALTGYVYSATILAPSYVLTLWLVAALVLLYALVARWLTLAGRHLLQRAARKGQTAAPLAGRAVDPKTAGAEAADLEEEYADIDLNELTEDSRALLAIAVSAVGLVGLYGIWSAVLPALGILDEVTLWQVTVKVAGEEQLLQVTLADLGLAMIYLIAMVVLAKRLPALLDLILMERFGVTSGSRYTITTLTTYAIVAIGTLLALNSLGAQWSQVQWLVAALGVGIGFGLQEIVANFISGLIILFERPVRVGDTVTVGNTDGVVTKIRIRATTIRNQDRKELLVPNKEFITGRLLNWSLSDQVTRVMVMVGVAYGTDVEKAHALMREAAEEQPHVLSDPKPVLTFEGFGDNALTLVLRAFIDHLDYRTVTITDLHKAINRKFEQAGIVIAFPQRDLHLDMREPLRVTLEAPRGGESR